MVKKDEGQTASRTGTKAAGARGRARQAGADGRTATARLRPDEATHEYDRRFDELVQSVAAELPHFEAEAGLPVPFPLRPRRSGVYLRRINLPPNPIPVPPLFPVPPPDIRPPQPIGGASAEAYPMAPPALDGLATEIPASPAEAIAAEDAALSLILEELRVDVDGLFPTMTVSGTQFRAFGGGLTWIARVVRDPNGPVFAGPISYQDGMNPLRYTKVQCQLAGSPFTGNQTAKVTFSGGGQQPVTKTYHYDRPHFREVGIEFDCASDATAVTSYNLGAHPNRPSDLPAVTLTIEEAFTRQGIKMTNTGQGDVVPIAKAGANKTWSDVEMHDAMQQHWSKAADVAQWQVWTLFAGRHDIGVSLGGIMFDDIGAAERQGCAVFSDSFISEQPPAGDPDPAAFIQRMRFWTAVHEIGHTFNLLHSWQKDIPTPWIPLSNEDEARSYMNYPYRVTGGPDRFFAAFYYRFSDDELLFLRHAPERFVQQGNADWLDHHAFEQARRVSSQVLELAVRVNRSRPANRPARFEALEPVIAELRLRNTTTVPVVVDRNCLYSEDVTVVLAREGGRARRWMPYSRYCLRAEPHVLAPGESLYAQVFLSAGRNGWDLAEPGRYRVYAALRTPAGHALAAPLALRVDPPVSREEENLMADIYTEEVGRVLAFGGSRVMTEATDILREAAQRLPDRRLAVHAASALSRVAVRPGRVLHYDGGRPRFDVVEPDTRDVAPLLDQAYGDLDKAAETLGHIRVTHQVEKTVDGLAGAGEKRRASELAGGLASTLEHRNVVAPVVNRLRQRSQRLKG